MRVIWRKSKSALMSSCRPGQRPAAFYKYELRIPVPSRWFEEIDVLDDRKLFSSAESVEIEREYPILSVSDPVAWSSYDESRFDRRIEIEKSAARKLEVAAQWHRRRGRNEIADLYATRAARLFGLF